MSSISQPVNKKPPCIIDIMDERRFKGIDAEVKDNSCNVLHEVSSFAANRLKTIHTRTHKMKKQKKEARPLKTRKQVKKTFAANISSSQKPPILSCAAPALKRSFVKDMF